MAPSPIISWQIDGETRERVIDFIFGGSKITEDGDCSHEIKRHLLLGRKVTTNLDSILKKQRCYFANKDPYSQRCGFMDVRVLKSWCFWTVVLEKTLESPLDCKEIKPVNPKGNQSPIFIGRTDAEAKTPILWPPDAKNWLIGKEPDAGKDWRWEQKGTTEHEIVGWRCQLNRHKFEQAPGVGEDREAWRAGVHGVAKSQPQLSNWTELLYGCESWTIKKTEHWRIDVIKLWCWWRLLRVPWTARRSTSQS